MNTEFIQWVNQQLEERDWKQSNLARRAGISSGTLSNILKGYRNPGIEVIVSIAQGLEVPVETALRKAGIISSHDDPTVAEIIELARGLSPQKRREAASYLLWLFQRKFDNEANYDND